MARRLSEKRRLRFNYLLGAGLGFIAGVIAWTGIFVVSNLRYGNFRFFDEGTMLLIVLVIFTLLGLGHAWFRERMEEKYA